MVKVDVNIKVIDPNPNKSLEEALSNMIAYQLANEKIKEIKDDT